VPGREFKLGRLALVALVGALFLEIVLTFAVGLREAFTVRQIPAHLTALLVGAVAGWIFELIREVTATTTEALRVAKQMQTGFEAFTDRITYQDRALAMLMACPRHNDALSKLIKASISDNYKKIPLIGELTI
jgi:type III secretory pathway component EscR